MSPKLAQIAITSYIFLVVQPARHPPPPPRSLHGPGGRLPRPLQRLLGPGRAVRGERHQDLQDKLPRPQVSAALRAQPREGAKKRIFGVFEAFFPDLCAPQRRRKRDTS